MAFSNRKSIVANNKIGKGLCWLLVYTRRNLFLSDIHTERTAESCNAIRIKHLLEHAKLSMTNHNIARITQHLTSQFLLFWICELVFFNFSSSLLNSSFFVFIKPIVKSIYKVVYTFESEICSTKTVFKSWKRPEQDKHAFSNRLRFCAS